MSIDPVQTVGAEANTAGASAVSRYDASNSFRTSSVRSHSEPKPRVEIHAAKSNSESAEMPRDEVQVQRVNGASGDIVIRYLDAAGHLILQIPSSQLLGLAKAIDQALEEQANRKAGAGETAPGQGETFHGR